jgi:lysophospholipase
MIEIMPPSTLQPRFKIPENWQWGYMQRDGYTLRYGWGMPSQAPEGAIVILPGLSEYCEKYFETAREALARNFSVLVIDWRGQGASSRYLKNPHKRHSQGFDKDATDLLALIKECPATHNQDNLFMLAHSMGGNIGLQILINNPDLFKGAGFSAPLIGLHALQNMPPSMASGLINALAGIMSKAYAPMGGDWLPEPRDIGGHLVFSNDSERAAIHNAWMIENPSLQVGHVTYQWLCDAHAACQFVSAKIKQGELKASCVIASAGHETFVSNQAILKAAEHCKSIQHIHIKEARHEIFMETNSVRSQLIDSFYLLIRQIKLTS